jgi:hypothetical protein
MPEHMLQHGYLASDCGLIGDTRTGRRQAHRSPQAERFFSREKEIEELSERAWCKRLRIEVWVERDALHRPLSIIVRRTPAPFHD